MAVAKSAGSFLGGILNNPGAIILGGIAILLVFFASDIRKAFGSFGESFGKIELPDITLPTFNFPEITFPSFGDIEFPSFDFDFPDFGKGFEDLASTITQGLDDISKTFVPPESIDVPFGDTDQIIDVVPDTTGGKAGLLDAVINPPIDTQLLSQDDSLNIPVIQGGEPPFLSGSLTNIINQIAQLTTLSESQAAALSPDVQQSILESILPQGISPVEQATAIVGLTQEQFQEQAAAFVQESPILTGSTSLPGSQIIFGEQIVKEQEDFQSFIDIEKQQAEQIFQKLFGDVQNPDFPITLGEFIGGKAGTVVSPSLFGASESEIEAFFANQGF